MPAITVVIPCFNQGHFVDDAVESALAQTCRDLDVIVVDCGSSDPATVAKLKTLQRPRCRVLRTNDRGLAAARNDGIAATTAEYIIPLDADDRIAPTFVAKAIAAMESDPAIGIVSCEAEFFGLHSGRWELRPYRFPEILLRNSLFATALFRRADWETVAGYNTEMIYGYEDYDFWLSLISRGRKVHRLPEALFFYRRTTESMVTRLDLDKKVYSYRKLYEHHRELYHSNMEFLFRTFLEQSAALEAREGAALVQVFLPAADGFGENWSIRSNYPRGTWSELRLTTPAPAGMGTRWRIDPGVGPGLYELAQIAVTTATGSQPVFRASGADLRALATAQGTALMLPEQGRLRVLSFGADPQIIIDPLPIPESTGVLHIDLVLRVTDDLGEAASAFAEANRHLSSLRFA